MREDNGTPLATRRGRQDTTQKFAVGRGTYVLDNRRLHFEQLYSGSPFYGKLLPTKPVQSGEEYPWLPGIMADGVFHNALTYTTWTPANATVAAAAADQDLGLPGLQVVASTTGVAWTMLGPATPIRSDKLGGPLTASFRVTTTSFGNSFSLAIRFYSDLAGTTLISQTTGTAVNVNSDTPDQRVDVVVPTIPSTALSARMYLIENAGAFSLAGDVYLLRAAVMDYTAVSFFEAAFTGFADSWVCT
ncbi:MAG: hypothetical protein ACREMY_12965, partial [bacterium]